MADDELQPTPSESAPVAPDSTEQPDTSGAADAPPAKRTANKTATKSAAKKAPAKKVSTAKAAAARSATAKSAAKKTTTKKSAAVAPPAETVEPTEPAEASGAAESSVPDVVAEPPSEPSAPAKKTAAKKTAAKRPAKKTTAKKAAASAGPEGAAEVAPGDNAGAEGDDDAAEAAGTMPLFQAPVKTTTRTRTRKKAAAPAPEPETEDEAEDADETVEPDNEFDTQTETGTATDSDTDTDTDRESDDDSDETAPRRRRRRGGRRRRRGGGGGEGSDAESGDDEDSDQAEDSSDKQGAQGKQGTQAKQGGQARQGGQSKQGPDDSDDGEGGSSSSRRRRKRRREGDDGGQGGDDPANTTTRVRRGRSAEDEITAVSGSTRLEAKKQRRREGREAGRRRAPIVSEAEFLARRESVDRVMAIRQRDDLTQIAVIEDKVLVEHYVARESQTSLIGNVYLGRVQNVLPSMEAAFIDIGKGRNAVLYAGEVNWGALGHKDGSRKIESVLSSGQTILVQVTKDPIGHKGARLTSQISLAGRFLVLVPDGTTSGISRKLPDTERNRLKTLLKEIVPDTAGVIVRTAAEGASEEELTRDVERLTARWDDIEAKTKGKASSPQLLYGEPDLTLKVVRDLFTEDFAKLVIQGSEAWDLVQGYVAHVASDLEERLERYDVADHQDVDIFGAYRVDEQIAKALDRKVWLPSGGSLVIDRTEAMTVVDVNTGKFTGSGGNLEETVTKNNLEAAEEVVRQLRLRDIGGIIVVDFIDMVLESNRDLVLRRLVECLGRDRTRHQVAEVTSLGLVQMTRKRIGTGLLEAFTETCDHCAGRGLMLHDMPVESKRSGNGGSGGNGGGNGGGNNGGDSSSGTGGGDDEPRRGRRRGGRGRGEAAPENGSAADAASSARKPTPAEFAAMAKHAEAKEAAEAAEADAAGPFEATEPTEPTEGTDDVAEPAVDLETTAEADAVGDPAAAVADETVEVPVESEALPEPAAAPEPEPAPAPPSTPQVATRTRRGVSRVATTKPPAAVELTVPSAAVPPTPVSAPEPPKVTTRTRGGTRRSRADVPATEPADGSA